MEGAVFILLHDANAYPKLITLFGIVGNDVKFEQYSNTESILVTLFGIVGGVFNLLQNENVPTKPETLFGIVGGDDKFVQ